MPGTPIHPGELLKDEMEALNLNAAGLARAIHVPAERIRKILSGKRKITADTALRLGILFSRGPHFWLNLRMAYELDLAKASGRPDITSIVPLVKLVDTPRESGCR